MACIRITRSRLAQGTFFFLLFTTLYSTSVDASLERGRSAYARGDFEQALQEWTQAERSAASSGNAAEQIDSLLNQAGAHQSLGRNRMARNILQRALPIAERLGDTVRLASVSGALGDALARTGAAEQAQPYFDRSLAMADTAGRKDIAAVTLTNLGNLHTAQGRYKEALATYHRAAELAAVSGKQILQARSLTSSARSALALERPAEALRWADAAVAPAQALGESHDKTYALIAIAHLYHDLVSAGHAGPERLRRAHDLLREAEGVATRIGDLRAGSYATGYLATLYELQGRHQEALQLTSRAIFMAQQANAPEILYRWQRQSGRLLNARGELDTAIEAYRHAVYNLQTIRSDLSQGYAGRRSSFLQTEGPIYFELADLLLRRSAQFADRKLAKPFLIEARDTVEQLKVAELQDYFQDDCVTEYQSRITRIDKLADHTTVIYPILLEDRTELLLMLPDGIQQFTVPVPKARMIAAIRKFRTLIEKRTTREYLEYAMQLHDWLIGPIEPELKRQQIHTLVMVPDSALRTIPIAALFDGKQFLISKYAVATTPGLTLTDPRPMDKKNMQVLLAGLSHAVQGYYALPSVPQEIDNIRKLYGGRLLLNQDYSLNKVEGELVENPYTIVHIASHGEFDGDVNKTFLLTHDDKLTINLLDRYMGYSRYRDNPVELLTLSACQTAAGDDRAALGLAGVAVKAGARSALATLWFINDRATSRLVSDFYRQLKGPATSKAVALQQAQQKLIKDKRFRHPGYWAAFLLIGNWL